MPRLLLISGWAHDASAMEDLGHFLENTADVSSVSTGDLWGANPATGPLSSYAQNLVRMIESKAGRPFVAAWSLGGMIALEAACARPDLFAGLILISSTPKFCAGEGWAAGAQPSALRAMIQGFKRDAQNTLRTFFKNTALPSGENSSAIQARIARAGAMNPLELSAGLEYLYETDLRNKASRVNIPALILHGRQDAIVPAEAGIALKNILPVSGIRVHDNYGHGLPWQNSRAIAEDMMGFLEECQNRNTKIIHQ